MAFQLNWLDLHKSEQGTTMNKFLENYRLQKMNNRLDRRKDEKRMHKKGKG